MNDEYRPLVRLAIALGLRHRVLRELISVVGDPRDFENRDVLERLPLKGEIIESIERVGAPAVERVLERMERASVWLLPITDGGYPPLLRMIRDAPGVLFVRGGTDLASAPSLCIVGSRRASREGAQFAARLAGDLSREGFLVTSGLARGIDQAAHRGALDAGGETVAVLGCGADVVYPRACRNEYRRILGQGAVVSELLPGAGPRPEFFPRRNRIMSGMSLAVIVVEAAGRSGALITADMALEEGREVFAVPGSPVNPVSRGTNDLIRQGAHIVESADDVLRGLEYGGRADEAGNAREEHQVLIGLLAGGPKSIDELSRLAGANPADVLTLLAEMELSGRVTQVPGMRYVLSKTA